MIYTGFLDNNNIEYTNEILETNTIYKMKIRKDNDVNINTVLYVYR